MRVSWVVRRSWPLLVIAALSLAVIVIGGGQKDVPEYRVVKDWRDGPFLSNPLDTWTLDLGDIATVRRRDGTLHVAWTQVEDLTGQPVVLIKKGEDDGLTWSQAEEIRPEIQATGHSRGISLFEDSSSKMWLAWSIQARGSFPHQIWVSVKDNATGPWSKLGQVTRTEDWYREDTDASLSCLELGYDRILSDHKTEGDQNNETLRWMYDCWSPAFAESNGTVYVYWISNKNYQKGWIWRSGTRDGGSTWSEPLLMEGSAHYQAFLQASDGGLWIGGTECGKGEMVWIMESDDLGTSWSEKKILGAGAFPSISQVKDRIYVIWQSNRYSPTVTETALRGAGGEPYVWEIQTSDLWFSTAKLGEEASWSREAKLIEKDSHEEHGTLLEIRSGVALVYFTSEGLPDQYGDPPSQWRVRVATNQEPTEPMPIQRYRERKLEGVVIG